MGGAGGGVQMLRANATGKCYGQMLRAKMLRANATCSVPLLPTTLLTIPPQQTTLPTLLTSPAFVLSSLLSTLRLDLPTLHLHLPLPRQALFTRQRPWPAFLRPSSLALAI